MRGVGLVPIGHDADDVAVAQFRFDARHLRTRDVGDAAAGEFVFDADEGGNERGVGAQLAVEVGLFSHVGHATVEFFAAEGRGDVLDQSAAFVVADPVLEMVQTRVEAPGAASVAVAVHLDESQHFLRRVGRGMQGDEPPHAEGDFEERPAIHPGHVDRLRLDGVVQLQRVVHVGRAAQGEGEFVDPFPEGKLSPARAVTAVHELLEFFLSDECFVQGQSGRRPGRDRGGEQDKTEESGAHWTNLTQEANRANLLRGRAAIKNYS